MQFVRLWCSNSFIYSCERVVVVQNTRKELGFLVAVLTFTHWAESIVGFILMVWNRVFSIQVNDLVIAASNNTTMIVIVIVVVIMIVIVVVIMIVIVVVIMIMIIVNNICIYLMQYEPFETFSKIFWVGCVHSFLSMVWLMYCCIMWIQPCCMCIAM